MADVTNNMDPCTILLGQAAIRHDVGLAEANIRDRVSGAEAEIRDNVRHAEANIRDNVRHAEANIRHDQAAGDADIRHDIKKAEADTRHDLAAGDAEIRRDVTKSEAEIRHEIAAEACKVNDSVKTSGWKVSDRVGTEADRIVAQDTAYFIATQKGLDDIRLNLSNLEGFQQASFERTRTEIKLAAAKNEGHTTLYGERNLGATQLAQATLLHKIESDGAVTRSLLNELKMAELNRMLVERNAEIVENRHDSRYWHGQFNNSQQANLVSQVNALSSQFQETRQGMVNFGTMAGVGQSSTSNNVR